MADDDLSLPKATVQKVIKEMMPSHLRMSNEAKDLVIECCVEFINLIASESNEICDKKSKKTIYPEMVVEALKNLEFDEYIAEAEEVMAQHKHEVESVERPRKSAKKKVEISDEMIAEQQKMFAAARARAMGQAAPQGSSADQS